MKVSVIIPTYNRRGYIRQAVESVLAQTFQDLEIIVVDDGSTDGTDEVLRDYSNRITYIYVENRGFVEARNTGMKAASGEYIAWLDSDDLYHPHKTALEVAVLDAFPDVGFVYTDFSAFDDAGYWDEKHLRTYHTAYRDGTLRYEDIFDRQVRLRDAGIHVPEVGNPTVFSGRIFDVYLQNIIVFTNSIMFRRAALSVTGFAHGGFGQFGDMEFVLRLSKHYDAAFVDVPTYKLRYHPQQISSTAGPAAGRDVVLPKQQQLLAIVETHGKADAAYYAANKPKVDRRLAVLHRAVAIPLLALPDGARSARGHLAECARLGYPQPWLSLTSRLPCLARRVVLRAMRRRTRRRGHRPPA
jgi:GT2 family glycosyltransferase